MTCCYIATLLLFFLLVNSLNWPSSGYSHCRVGPITFRLSRPNCFVLSWTPSNWFWPPAALRPRTTVTADSSAAVMWFVPWLSAPGQWRHRCGNRLSFVGVWDRLLCTAVVWHFRYSKNIGSKQSRDWDSCPIVTRVYIFCYAADRDGWYHLG